MCCDDFLDFICFLIMIFDSKQTNSRKLKAKLELTEKNFKDAAIKTSKLELLKTEEPGYQILNFWRVENNDLKQFFSHTRFIETEGLEKTYKLKQADVAKIVDEQTSKKVLTIKVWESSPSFFPFLPQFFTLDLDKFGPYKIDFQNNGRHLLIGGRKGHIAMMDWLTRKLYSEIFVNETIKDVK